MKKLPTLYTQTKKGKINQWTTWAEGDTVFTEYGEVDGKLQTASYIAEPKNVGRANETTAQEQAEKESKALWDNKITRKYSATKKEAKKPLELPMLAHTYEGRYKDNFEFPANLQYKLDGVRCIAHYDGKDVKLTSRQGRDWVVPHISKELTDILSKQKDPIKLDGEIYVHDLTFQEITSLVKRADPSGKKYSESSLRLEYHIYDMPLLGTFSEDFWKERRVSMSKIVKPSDVIKIVPTLNVNSHDDVINFHDAAVASGYEGVMLRSLNGTYLCGHRSRDLLKYKVFDDGEFVITDVIEGIGKMAGCGIFICQNDMSDHVFECTMKATMLDRAKHFKNRKKYLGKKLTVKYFKRTDSKIP